MYQGLDQLQVRRTQTVSMNEGEKSFEPSVSPLYTTHKGVSFFSLLCFEAAACGLPGCLVSQEDTAQ